MTERLLGLPAPEEDIELHLVGPVEGSSPPCVLLVDVDNTLADTAAEWVRIFGRPADPSDYFAYVPHGFDMASDVALEVYARACPIDGAREALGVLKAHGVAIWYTSARPAVALEVTRRWLFQHDFPPGSVDCRKNSKLAAAKRAAQQGMVPVLVDDRPSPKLRGKAMVLMHRRPWSPEGLSWPEVRDAVLHLLESL